MNVFEKKRYICKVQRHSVFKQEKSFAKVEGECLTSCCTCFLMSHLVSSSFLDWSDINQSSWIVVIHRSNYVNSFFFSKVGFESRLTFEQKLSVTGIWQLRTILIFCPETFLKKGVFFFKVKFLTTSIQFLTTSEWTQKKTWLSCKLQPPIFSYDSILIRFDFNSILLIRFWFDSIPIRFDFDSIRSMDSIWIRFDSEP